MIKMLHISQLGLDNGRSSSLMGEDADHDDDEPSRASRVALESDVDDDDDSDGDQEVAAAQVGGGGGGSHNASPFDDFLFRDFSSVKNFWSGIVKRPEALPTFLRGDSEYGISDLESIHTIGEKEYSSTDPRFKKKTFALCIMYNGTSYSGYQQQKGVEGVHTVEDDLDEALNRKVVAAGRTDKGVSAISQIVSFATFDDITPEEIISKIKISKAGLLGTLNIRDCQRVPKKFNALFSATWRRYTYIFPLNSYDEVDVSFIKEALKQLENKALPFNNFAYRENRDCGNGNKDICTLYRTNATVFDLGSSSTSTASTSPPHSPSCDPQTVSISPALCIELVGSRFLRRMVRIITSTVIRESIRDPSSRNVKVLEEIALSGNRSLVAYPVSGIGLAMSGVGYDLSDLAVSTVGKTKAATGKRKITTTPTEAISASSIKVGVISGNNRSRNNSNNKLNGLPSISPGESCYDQSLQLQAIKVHKNDCASCLKELDSFLFRGQRTKRVLDVNGEPEFKYILLSEHHSLQEPKDPTILTYLGSLQGASIVQNFHEAKRFKKEI